MPLNPPVPTPLWLFLIHSIHLFTTFWWNNSFIQAEVGIIPPGLDNVIYYTSVKMFPI